MKCPNCHEAGLVKQSYGLKCVFCGHLEKSAKKKKIKRVVLGEGTHWFYSKHALQGKNTEHSYDLIGILDKDRQLIPLKNLPQSRKVKLILEYKI